MKIFKSDVALPQRFGCSHRSVTALSRDGDRIMNSQFLYVHDKLRNTIFVDNKDDYGTMNRIAKRIFRVKKIGYWNRFHIVQKYCSLYL